MRHEYWIAQLEINIAMETKKKPGRRWKAESQKLLTNTCNATILVNEKLRTPRESFSLRKKAFARCLPFGSSSAQAAFLEDNNKIIAQYWIFPSLSFAHFLPEPRAFPLSRERKGERKHEKGDGEKYFNVE